MNRCRNTIWLALRILLAACLVVLPTQGWCADPSPIEIPKRGDPKWTFSPPDDQSLSAPSGYEGRTDTSSMTATGRAGVPETEGRSVYARFELSNQIKTCPSADGYVEGDGVFSFTVRSTKNQAGESSTMTIDRHAKAKYKGRVGENGYLEGPVTLDLDYTFTQTGVTRHAGGGLTTIPSTPSHQNMTLTFMVPPGEMALPNLQGFAGGDPIAGHYVEASGFGLALSFWGGIFYSVAQVRWRQGECAQVVFDPPGATVALGGETKVKVQVKPKEGDGIADAMSTVIPQLDRGSVDPGGGSSKDGSPLKLTYRAPDKKVANSGFRLKATSRAGVAEGEWKADMGSGWSGQISCTREINDGGASELLDWSSHDSMKVTYNVKDDIATATGHGEVRSTAARKQKALRGGALTIITYSRENSSGSADGTSPASVNVSLNKAKGTYSIGASIDSIIAGNVHGSVCGDNGKCQQSDSPLYVDSCVQDMRGSLSDLNQLHGTMSDNKPAGYQGKGTKKLTVTWDLARKGGAE